MTVDRRALLSRMVTFEGADNVGKTSIIEKTAKAFRENDYRVVVARCPGTTELGEHLRGFLKDPQRKPMRKAVEAQLQFAGFFQLFDEVVYPNLTDPDNPADLVLVDRFALSTYMYQRNKENDMLIKLLTSELYKYMGGHPLRIIVDASEEELQKRRVQSSQDWYESNEGLQRHIIEQYRVFADRYPEITVHNNRSLDEAVTNAMNIIFQHVLLEPTT